MMDVDIYHDESKQDGFWHGILVVPRDSRAELLDRLAVARATSGHEEPIGVKSCRSGKTRRISCLTAWVSVGVSALLHKGGEAFSTGKTLIPGKGHRVNLQRTARPLNAKFCALRCPENLGTLSGDWKENVETTLKITLKGALHYYATHPNAEAIRIRNLYVDGHEHYAGHLDETRILDRLRREAKPSITIAEDARLFDFSSDHRRAPKEAYDHCQLLQLADCLVGGVRLHVTAPEHHLVTAGHLSPLAAVMDRFEEGWARMRHSRYGMNFSMSSMELSQDGFTFAPVRRARPGGASQAQLELGL